MPNKNYEAGRRLEYKIRDHYRKRGWVVVRASGSHSPFDLVAFRADGGPVHAIQAKRIKKGTEHDALRLWRTLKADKPVPPSSHYSVQLWVQVGRETYRYGY